MLINYIFIPIIAAFFAYLLNKKGKYIGSIITSLISAYILYQLIALYGNWSLNQKINLSIMGNELQLLFANNPLSWLFGIMTASATLLISIFTIKSQENYKLSSAFNFNFLILFGSIIGVVFANDFLSLFIFWELMTWTSFYIISGGKKAMAKKSAYRYFVLSAVGAYTMLMAIFMIYSKTGNFAIAETANYLQGISTTHSLTLMFMLALPFLTKAGLFPVHIWVKGAHGNAPKEFSPFLSGLMLKVGIYGLMLIFFLLPFSKVIENTIAYRGLSVFSYLFALFGAITTVTGTILAIRQEDMKKLIAYSSISQMGYIIMGIAIATPLGLTGGLLHMMNHLIFLALAAVIYRTGTTKMYEMGGLIFRMPLTFATYLTAIIALAGIPPTNGFISKWVIYQALIEKGYIFLAVAAFFGSIGSFMYVFKPLSTVFLGQLKPQHEKIKEVPFLMQLPMYILMILMLLFGVVPGIQMNIISKISSFVGMEAVNYSLFTIEGAYSAWNSLIIFNIFTGGFVLSLFIFILARKSKLVGLLDTYTSGEYMNDAEAYHFAYKYYRPFDRMFDGFAAKSLTKAYESLAENIAKIGNGIRKTVITGNGQSYAFYAILFFVILAIAGWII
ncbi:MAG: proton-conducting transporter membrane subunit [Halanaerobiales bacterium]